MSDLLPAVLVLAVLVVGAVLLVRWARADAFTGLPHAAPRPPREVREVREVRERREPGRREATGLSNRGSAVAELGVSYRR